MSNSPTRAHPPPDAPETEADRVEELTTRFDAIARENEDLGTELLRSYEQLNLVFEITERIANLREPRDIQHALLGRYATMLATGAVYFDCDGQCEAFDPAIAVGRPVKLDPAAVRTALARPIANVRRASNTQAPALDEGMRTALNGAHVLLGALRSAKGREAEAGVVIALRDASEASFDSADILASESVLGYGGYILSNVLMVRHLQQTALETVCALANAIDAKDNYTSGHSERVGWLAKLTGAALQVPESQLQVLEWSGLLHDVGKIGVPERILNKPGKLTDEEFAEIKKHPVMSYEVLKPVASLEPILCGLLHHHENHDGSGYPAGLAGDDIPFSARVLHVVDIFDALTSTRSYRKAFSVAKAFRILTEEAGRVTDPRITRVFLTAFGRYVREQPNDFRTRFAHLADDLDQVPDADAIWNRPEDEPEPVGKESSNDE